MRKKKLLQNLYLKLRNTTSIFFCQVIEIAVNCIRNRFHQKDHIETLETIELCEEDFGHELQQMSSFISSDLHKFKLEDQLKTLTHIVDQKQVGIKYAITTIWSLTASQRLLASEVLKIVRLILTVPDTNTVSERSCSILRRFRTYL